MDKLIDELNDQINLRDRYELGVDLCVGIMTEGRAELLCKIYNESDCGYMIVGAIFDSVPYFCWGIDKEHCDAWVRAH